MKYLTIPQCSPAQGWNSTAIIPLIIQDLEDRQEFGLRKYGSVLKSPNGRNNLVDIYQELLDCMVYVRAELHESDTEPPELW